MKMSGLGFNKVNKLAIGLIALVFLMYLLTYLYVNWSGEANCVDVFKRPHEQFDVIVRKKKPDFDFSQLEANDSKQLINLTNFVFLENNKVACANSDVFLLVLVPSAPKNKAKRDSIRKTWGDKDEDVKILFLLGVSEDIATDQAIKKESRLYADIVQGNFVDSYKNITYKSVMSLKYVIYHCPKAAYVLKVDDDSYVNMPLLKNFLMHDISPYGARNLWLCNDMTGSPVLRDPKSKWYVSKEEFPDEFYPSYCSGWYSIFSPDVCFKMYREAQKLQYLFVEDAFLGIAAKNADLVHTDISYHTLAFRNKDLLFNGTYDHIAILFGFPNMSPKHIQMFYEYFQSKPVPLSIHNKLGHHL